MRRSCSAGALASARGSLSQTWGPPSFAHQFGRLSDTHTYALAIFGGPIFYPLLDLGNDVRIFIHPLRQFPISAHRHLGALHFTEHQLSDEFIFAYRMVARVENRTLYDELIQPGFEFRVGSMGGVGAFLRFSFGDFVNERHGCIRVDV